MLRTIIFSILFFFTTSSFAQEPVDVLTNFPSTPASSPSSTPKDSEMLRKIAFQNQLMKEEVERLGHELAAEKERTTRYSRSTNGILSEELGTVSTSTTIIATVMVVQAILTAGAIVAFAASN